MTQGIIYSQSAYPYVVEDLSYTITTNEETGITEVTGLPFSLEVVKSWVKLSLNNTAFDNELIGLILTAVEYAEKYTRRLVVKRKVVTQRLGWGECRNGRLSDVFTLRRSPLVEVESIKYEGNTLPEENYSVFYNPSGYGMIKLKGDLPELTDDAWFPIEITFQAGYDKIPSIVLHAMKMHIASLWMNRGDTLGDNVSSCPADVRSMYKSVKINEIGA